MRALRLHALHQSLHTTVYAKQPDPSGYFAHTFECSQDSNKSTLQGRYVLVHCACVVKSSIVARTSRLQLKARPSRRAVTLPITTPKQMNTEIKDAQAAATVRGEKLNF